MTTHETKFGIGDHVSIDDGSVAGVVIGICIYPHGVQAQVSWWNNGAICEQWLAEWRLSRTGPSGAGEAAA